MISSDQIDNLFSATMPQASNYDNLSSSALGRGIDLYLNSDYDGAVKEFKRSIALSPQSDYAGKAYEYLTQTLLKQNKSDDAVKALKQYIKSDPTNDAPRLSLGNIYFSNGQYSDALDQYSMAVRLEPNSANNRYALGMTYLKTGKYTDALAQFQRLVQLSPADPNAYDALGQALHKLNRNDDAIAQFKKAVGLNKDFADGYQNLGETYADLKQTDNALNQVQILSTLDSDKASELTQYMETTADPKIIAAYGLNGFSVFAGRNTAVATMNSDLTEAGAYVDYTFSFMFSKDMDVQSVQNPLNWKISRATSQTPGGPYNLGLPVTSTEISLPVTPFKATYDASSRSATITFRITQNASGNGTLDPSHVVFQFKGTDADGNPMDTSADEYSGVSKIV
ncbi:MAG TPA: tetratricopeptide repeat protein [Nitrospirota bacterium]|nr:tetratricopeptide repeat protein [Nitrospirota bacterium]